MHADKLHAYAAYGRLKWCCYGHYAVHVFLGLCSILDAIEALYDMKEALDSMSPQKERRFQSQAQGSRHRREAHQCTRHVMLVLVLMQNACCAMVVLRSAMTAELFAAFSWAKSLFRFASKGSSANAMYIKPTSITTPFQPQHQPVKHISTCRIRQILSFLLGWLCPSVNHQCTCPMIMGDFLVPLNRSGPRNCEGTNPSRHLL